MTKETEAKWAERVRDWRASGQSAEDFAKGKGYEGATLRWAASFLQKAEAPAPAATARPTRARAAQRAERTAGSSAAPGEPPRFVPLRARAPKVAAEMVVEIGAARIHVSPGMDLAFLGDVVRALGVVR